MMEIRASWSSRMTPRAAEHNRHDIAEARTASLVRQAELNPERLLFFDGSTDQKSIRWNDFPSDGASTNLAPTSGRGPRGHRVEGVAPHGRWSTTTFIAAWRHDGLSALCVVDGAIAGRALPRPAAVSLHGVFGVKASRCQ
jgi:hypothetical protein